MKKRKISLALILSMLFTLMMPTLAFGAVDYSGHWAEDTIQEWFDNDMLKGYEDGSFRPNVQISRAEFMTMVNNAFEYTEKADTDFIDVDSDDWFYPEVQKAVKSGYLLGYEDNTARPDNKITRQEAALMIARIKDLDNYAAGAARFADVAEIAAWAIGGVGAVTDEGYVIGYEDITFRPLRFISRAEALVIIDRAMDKVEDPDTDPGTGGSGGNGGGGNGGGDEDPAPYVTPAAISYSFDEEGEFVVVETTTSAAIETTRPTIYVKVVTYDGEEVAISHSTTKSAIITPTSIETVTSSAIEGVIVYNAEEIGLADGDNYIFVKVIKEDEEDEFILHVFKEGK